jgi:hypothetical protein
VGAGGRIEKRFLMAAERFGDTEVPVTLSFHAQFEPQEDEKVWVQTLSISQTVPYVTGVVSLPDAGMRPSGPPQAIPSRRTGRNQPAPPEPEERSRPAERRMEREANRPAPSRPPASPAAPLTRYSIQQTSVGLQSSVVLTLGKPMVLSEDNQSRTTLTVRKVE